MKKIYSMPCRFFFQILSLSLFLSSLSFGQLNGTYTIGSGGSYSTFTAAVSALTSSGVSGPVTFNVKSGLYNEQIDIGQITGSGAVNTITFQSQAGSADSVNLFFAPTVSNNYVVRLNQTDYTIFKNMKITATGSTYGTVLQLAGDANNNQLINDKLVGISTPSSSGTYILVYSTASSVDNFSANGCTFTDGSYGIYLDGVSGSTLSLGTSITNNTFSNEYSPIFLRFQSSPVFNGNTILNGGSRGIEIQSSSNAIEVQKNKITTTGGSAIGIYLYACTGGTGSPAPALVANNFITTTASSSTGIDLYSSGNVNVYNNSVNVTAASSVAFYEYAGTANSINVVNNNFANTGGGEAVTIYTTTAINSLHHNNLYTPGNFIANWNSVDYIDLPAYQAASSKEASSVTYIPNFTSSTNLHTGSPWLNAKGIPLSVITNDIDGDARDGSTPDIGADEYTPSGSVTTPLSGAYTIGAAGNYTTFAAAVADLVLKGVSGPVTFNIATGNYQEHIIIPSIPGSSPSNTITFQASTGNPANATLYFTAAAPESNYVVLLSGAGNIRFRKMTLRANNAANAIYGTIFLLQGKEDNCSLDTCLIYGSPNSSSSANYIMFYGVGARTRNLFIRGNTFIDGGYGIYLDGPNVSPYSTGTQVLYNIFNNSDYAAAWMRTQDSPMFNSNTITNASSRGIEIQNSSNAIEVQKNKITTNGGSAIAVYLYACTGGTISPAPALIANNFITTTASSSTGIDLYSSGNVNVYNNSVNVTAASSVAFYEYAGATNSINVVNNNFANTGAGEVVTIYSIAAINALDYNNLYTPGNFIANWNSIDYIDLPTYKSGSGKEVNSVAYIPNFTSSTNLHTGSPWLNAKGTSLPVITNDIDGDARDGSTPDIGADEYTPSGSASTPLSGAYTIGAAGNYTTFSSAVADLLLKGVSGPVTFNIATGNYQEHIIIPSVPGSSPTNTITFQAATGNPANATLYFTATAPESNYVVLLSGADNIRFRKMTLRANSAANATYGTVFLFMGKEDNCSLDSCLIYGSPNSSSSANFIMFYGTATRTRNLFIRGNTFIDGGYGIYLDGPGGTSFSTGTQILYNTFNNSDYAAAWMRYQDAPMFNSNTITNASSRGIEIQNSSNAIEVQKNKITTNGGSAIAVYLYACAGGTGFPNAPVLIANNFITTTASSSTGIDLYSSGNVNVYNNSVNVTAASSVAFYEYAGATNSINVVNNNFANTGAGEVVTIYSIAAINTMDYNNLYTPGSYIANWNSIDYIDLPAYKAASGKEVNSVAYLPNFTSSTNLHTGSPWLNAKGTSLPVITNDIDGDARDGSTPDIGADEYTPSGSASTPLSGVYTIGAAGNYTTFSAAVADLLLKGVSGPVTFNVLTGVYTEHFILYNVPGSNSTNTVTFQSQTGNAANVTLKFAAAAPESNYVVELYGASNIRFRTMSLQSNTGISATYSTAVYLAGGTNNLILDSLNLTGTPNGSGSTNLALIYGSAILTRSVIIRGSNFNDDGYGIYLVGLSIKTSSETQIIGNTFKNQDYSGIQAGYQDAPIFNNNNIINATYRGIEIDNSSNGIEIQKNKISASGSGAVGLYIYSCVGGTGFPNSPILIANNFIATTAGSSYGVDLYNSGNINFYNNSVNVSGVSSIALYEYAAITNSINIVNNVIANTAGGYTFAMYTTAGINTSDYNDLYSTGTVLGYWGSDGATLSALQTLSGKDANSISVNPTFFSKTNLHTFNSQLEGKGTPLAEVTDDIDGEARSVSAPEIGADEFGVTVTNTQTIKSSWNMLSLAASVNDPRLATLYPGASSHSYIYGPAGYTVKDSLPNRLGYWIKFSSDHSNSITGTPRTNDTIPVVKGWNLIGSISAEVGVTRVVQIPNNLTTSNYYFYSPGGGYITADSIKPGIGYWIKTNAIGSLVLDINNNAASAPKQPANTSATGTMNMISVERAGGHTLHTAPIYFAQTQDAGVSGETYALPPMPPEGALDLRFSSNRYVETFSSANGARSEIQFTVQGDGSPLKLSWLINESQTNYILTEHNKNNVQHEHRLTSQGSIVINVDGTQTFSIRTAEVPKTFSLEQNFPNPFNPSTEIRYQIAGKEFVSLKVYDILGQEAATLVNEVLETGFKSVTWDASNVPSGMYFYKLTAGSYTEVKKMILMK